MKFIGGLDSDTSLADITSVVAGTGLSGGGTTGAVTLNVDASIPEITTLAGLTSFGAAGATTNIVAGDLTMYNPVNDGNPTISLGKDVNDRFEIKTVYNSGTQTIDEVYFSTYTTSIGTNDGRYIWEVDEVQLARLIDSGLTVYGNISCMDADTAISITDTTASSATQGGKLRLQSDDDAVMGDNHRLGVIEFKGAEDAGSGAGLNTKSIGARIQAICRDAWDGSNNDADLEFYTTDGTTETKVLTLDAGNLATFTGGIKNAGRNGGEVITVLDMTTSSATQGGNISLISDDDAVMGDNHRLGVIEFKGAEDAGSGAGLNTHSIGARIQAIARDAWDGSNNDADLEFYTTDGTTESKALTLDADNLATFAGNIRINDATTSSATEGSRIQLQSNDGAAMGDDHRLGAITFRGAEDGSSTMRAGAKIQAMADAAWSDTVNDTRLEFYTMDGDNGSELSLTLDSDLLATFAGDVRVTGALTGTLATASQSAITTLAGLTSFGSAGATTKILAGDLTVYNAVNDGNPTISLGSSATDRFEIKSVYNSGAQTLCDVDFITYTASGTAHDGRFHFYVDEVLKATINDNGIYSWGSSIFAQADGATLTADDTTASSATQGGKLRLRSNDGAAMGDDHRLGVIQFEGAEDSSSTNSVGARIQAICRDAWGSNDNDADLEFYTTDGTTESKVLTLDADKLATFTGAVTVTGALTGTLATASQTNITGVGTIDTGVWNGTAITSAYLDADTMHYSAQRQLTHHMIKDDISTGVIYISLGEIDAESGTKSNKNLPLLAPVAGKLLKVFLRTTQDMSASGHDTNLTWSLLTRAASATTTGNAAVIGTKAGAGPTDSSMVTYDFTTGVTGTNAIAAGDKVLLSVQSDAASADSSFFISCLWEWDLS